MCKKCGNHIESTINKKDKGVICASCNNSDNLIYVEGVCTCSCCGSVIDVVNLEEIYTEKY